MLVHHVDMGNSGLKQHYETAKKTGVLKISDGLGDFPAGFKQLEPHLRVLDLAGNVFTSIPSEISAFKSLKRLNFNQNVLKSIPDEIGELSKLECLSLSTNKLTRIPPSIAQLSHLKEVYLSENRIRDFPVVFCKLKQLVMLDLSKNRITRIPDEVQDLQVLELNLNQNQISEVSESIANCPRLKTLRLQENCLQLNSIPRAILTQSNISMIAVEGNLFDMKNFMELEGYDVYMERYTAVKKKMF